MRDKYNLCSHFVDQNLRRSKQRKGQSQIKKNLRLPWNFFDALLIRLLLFWCCSKRNGWNSWNYWKVKISWRIKNIDRQEDSVSSLRRKAEVLISALLRSSVSRGSDSHLGCHSLPLPFESSISNPCQTEEVHRLLRWTSSVWQGQEDSNPRPTVLETGTLPAELYPYTWV